MNTQAHHPAPASDTNAAAVYSRNVLLVVEYDGTPYAGWQWQDGLPTVQGTLATAIEKVTGVWPNLYVAGRTDAGVHARAQLCSFRTNYSLPAHRFPAALNAHLPDSVSIHEARDVSMDFCARGAGVRKHYRYQVYNGPQRVAHLATQAWHIRRPLDLQAMREGAAALVGEHDFEAFRSAHCDAPHAVRRIYDITITATPRAPSGQLVTIDLHGNAFCRHMCRILAGTLVAVGMHKRSAPSIATTLEQRDRKQAGVTAPAHGLTLMQVQLEELDLKNPYP